VDNNATTQTAPEVVEAMVPFFSQWYGNPSSMHTFGGKVAHDLDQARAQVADLIGADPQEIVFTSCGTESDNAAIWGTLYSYPAKRHIVTTRVEHPAVLNLTHYLSKRGYRVTLLPVDREGRLDLDQVEEAVSEETAIVSVMWANNETGVLFPVEAIGQIARAKGAVFHTDAVQAVGKIPIRLKESPINLLSFSGHKLHAPKGIGVLYIAKGTRFTPFIIGGHQEKGRRGGTENVPYIVGLGKACVLAREHLDDENGRVRALRDRLEEGIFKSIPNVLINGNQKERTPNTLSISFEYVEGESILLHLDREGICASSGSACTSGSLEPSHVLRAMGVPFTAAHGSIRFSLSIYNNDQDIDHILKVLPPIIEQLRELSPYWGKGMAFSGSCALGSGSRE
jgi:cysteine desulfurase